jgi:uncharacterized protein
MNKISFIEGATQLKAKNINSTLALLAEGATIPFISRYRKERTGGLDEVQVAAVRDTSVLFQKIIDRQSSILSSIEEQCKLTKELKEKIESCYDLMLLEDYYLPYKQRRKTRGDKAKELGLEPLAKLIMVQRDHQPEITARRFVKGAIKSTEDAISGAQDIIAEWVNENIPLREKLRFLYAKRSSIASKVIKGKKEEGEKYSDYFDYNTSLKNCPSYRFLAMYRANREGIVRMKVKVDNDQVEELLTRFFVKEQNDSGALVKMAAKDAYKRLLHPALENEALNLKKEEADNDAIAVFAANLRQLLLSPPLGNKRILAIDPGYRTGCKVVCLNESGELLYNETIFPHPPQKELSKAKSKIAQLVQAHKIEAIAIGDGTAGRETEFMVKRIHFDRDVSVFVVSEDGASIYSASAVGREEFPSYDVTVRGAVSIGRRLMDPLAELVKIDAKSIGVGQYQHEVDQKKLKSKLDEVVMSCVNEVGVDVNTASAYLLEYVSGLGPQLARNIVDYRIENGSISSRGALKKVPRLGDKAYEQCAGFLRVRESKNPLDNSAVHPEAYKFVKKIAEKINRNVEDLIGDTDLLNNLKEIDFPFVDKFTFRQIITELKKPGRDPRKKIKVLEFDETVKSIGDLFEGKKLNGIVTNITTFGAFVNLGIKENGLIHKSNMADTFVENPADYVKLHQHVSVKVISLDIDRKRIGLKIVED